MVFLGLLNGDQDVGEALMVVEDGLVEKKALEKVVHGFGRFVKKKDAASLEGFYNTGNSVYRVQYVLCQSVWVIASNEATQSILETTALLGHAIDFLTRTCNGHVSLKRIEKLYLKVYFGLLKIVLTKRDMLEWPGASPRADTYLSSLKLSDPGIDAHSKRMEWGKRAAAFYGTASKMKDLAQLDQNVFVPVKQCFPHIAAELAVNNKKKKRKELRHQHQEIEQAQLEKIWIQDFGPNFEGPPPPPPCETFVDADDHELQQQQQVDDLFEQVAEPWDPFQDNDDHTTVAEDSSPGKEWQDDDQFSSEEQEEIMNLFPSSQIEVVEQAIFHAERDSLKLTKCMARGKIYVENLDHASKPVPPILVSCDGQLKPNPDCCSVKSLEPKEHEIRFHGDSLAAGERLNVALFLVDPQAMPSIGSPFEILRANVLDRELLVEIALSSILTQSVENAHLEITQPTSERKWIWRQLTLYPNQLNIYRRKDAVILENDGQAGLQVTVRCTLPTCFFVALEDNPDVKRSSEIMFSTL